MCNFTPKIKEKYVPEKKTLPEEAPDELEIKKPKNRQTGSQQLRIDLASTSRGTSGAQV